MRTTRSTILLVAGIIFAGLAALLVAGWLAFVPTANEPGYEFVMAWGETGSAPGRFNDPTGIAVVNGEVFVADSRNGRIQVFDSEGNFKRQFGHPGDALGELGRPMNLMIHGGALYVPEYFNDRIQVFGLDGTPKRVIGGSGNERVELNAPGGVAVNDSGELYVADFYGHRVLHLDASGTFIRQWGTTGQTSHAVGHFYYPTDVALGPRDNIYMADGYGNRIQVFAPDGDFLHKWGGPFARGIYGPFTGWFTTVTSIAFGPDGDVFVADFYNDRVQKFAPDGTFLTSFGETGDGPGQFRHAMAVDVADNGSVFVTDFLNSRIQKWNPKQ